MYTGDCNGCGLCCTAKINGKLYVCEHLALHGMLGREGATRCKVHDTRKVGMPVRQIPVDGESSPRWSHCLPTYPREKDAVPPECSYVWENQENGLVQVQWEEGYVPELRADEVES